MKLVKTVLLSSLLSLGIPQAQADITNVVQNINIQLLGVQSGGPVTNNGIIRTDITRVKIGTQQVIGALGTATGNSFTPRAKLVVVSPLGEGHSAIQVRDGSNTVAVTQFFDHEQMGRAVSGSQLNPANHRPASLDFSIQRIVLQDAEEFPSLGLHFVVSGYAAEVTPASRDGSGNLTLDAAGTGDVGGALTILRGKVEVRGDRLEVVPVF